MDAPLLHVSRARTIGMYTPCPARFEPGICGASVMYMTTRPYEPFGTNLQPLALRRQLRSSPNAVTPSRVPPPPPHCA